MALKCHNRGLPDGAHWSAGILNIALRRARATFLPWFCMMLVAAGALGANPFRGETVGPFDLLLSQGGWGSKVAFGEIRQAERSDILDNYLPRWLQARKSLRAGSLPLWNPLPAGGEPGLLNLAAGELTPAFGLFAASPTPELGFYLATLFNLTVGGAGVYFFLRRRISALAAGFGGIAFMLCGFNAGWLYWPHVSTVIWIAWTLLGVDRSGTCNQGSRAIGIAVPFSLLLLGGFPFVALLGVGAALAFIFVIGALEPAPNIRQCVQRTLPGFAVGVGIAAPGLLGFGEWLRTFDLSYRAGGSPLVASDAKYLLSHAARNQVFVENTMYVGTVALFLAFIVFVAGAVLSIRRKCRPSPLIVFAAVLVAVGATLTFELIPRDWLAWAPGLSGNSWSRAICLLDLGISLAAACAVNWLWINLKLSIAIPLAAMLVAGQTLDQIQFFRLFNGPISNATFFPSRPLIDQISRNSQLFQSTVADESFLVSGVLGAYGIREWFAHGFKTLALRDVLDDVVDSPFTTATATRVGGGAFHLDSREFNALAVRYAIGGERMVTKGVGLPAEAMIVPKAPMPPMPEHRITQYVSIAASLEAQGLDLELATYGMLHQPGDLVVVLKRSDDAHILAQWRQPVSGIIENVSHTFTFPHAITLAPGQYQIDISYEGAQPGNALTVWSYPGKWAGCRVTVDGLPDDGCLSFGLNVSRDDLGSFVAAGNDGVTHLLENRDAPSGPYFLKDLKSSPNRASSNQVHIERSGNHTFDLVYTGSDPGFVVVPMSLSPGWKVELDGSHAHLGAYLGALPAVYVNPGNRLQFRYRPLGLVVGIPIALLTMLLMIAVALRARSMRTRSTQNIVPEAVILDGHL